MTALVANAGLDPAPIIAEAARWGPDSVFDVVARRWVDPWAGGLLDPVAVVVAALEAGLSLAGTAITIDALVHRREPALATHP
jgi:chaperonin GroEL (HSP60 family)